MAYLNKLFKKGGGGGGGYSFVCHKTFVPQFSCDTTLYNRIQPTNSSLSSSPLLSRGLGMNNNHSLLGPHLSWLIQSKRVQLPATTTPPGVLRPVLRAHAHGSEFCVRARACQQQRAAVLVCVCVWLSNKSSSPQCPRGQARACGHMYSRVNSSWQYRAHGRMKTGRTGPPGREKI